MVCWLLRVAVCGSSRPSSVEKAPHVCLLEMRHLGYAAVLLGKACFGETSLARTTLYSVPDAMPGTGSSQQRCVPLVFLLFLQHAWCFPLAPSFKVMLCSSIHPQVAASFTFLQLELLSSQSSGGWGDQADPHWLSSSLQPQVVLRRFYVFAAPDFSRNQK